MIWTNVVRKNIAWTNGLTVYICVTLCPSSPLFKCRFSNNASFSTSLCLSPCPPVCYSSPHPLFFNQLLFMIMLASPTLILLFITQLSLSPQTKSLHGEVRWSWGAHLLRPCCDFSYFTHRFCHIVVYGKSKSFFLKAILHTLELARTRVKFFCFRWGINFLAKISLHIKY